MFSSVVRSESSVYEDSQRRLRCKHAGDLCINMLLAVFYDFYQFLYIKSKKEYDTTLFICSLISAMDTIAHLTS